jgi:hypothetical protein
MLKYSDIFDVFWVFAVGALFKFRGKMKHTAAQYSIEVSKHEATQRFGQWRIYIISCSEHKQNIMGTIILKTSFNLVFNV